MSNKHGWNDLDNYLHVAQRAVDNHPFVVRSSLFTQRSPETGDISGDILCHEDIELNVIKHFEIKTVGNRTRARTVRYAYHAHYKNGKNILRYDNHDRHGHPTVHHKHEYDEDGEEAIVHVGNAWPHLSEVLDELQRRIWGAN